MYVDSEYNADMRLKMGLILTSVLAFLVLTVPSAPKDELPSGETLISDARSREVWTEGTPAVRMRGQIEVSGSSDTVAQGDYAVDWVSPSQWREEIRFANYQRIRIRDAKGYWQKGSLDYQPYLIYLLNNLVDLKSVLSVSSKETFGKVKTRRKDGIQQRCVDLNATKTTNRILCFDDKSGALVAMERPQGEYENPPELPRIEYKDFRSIAGKFLTIEDPYRFLKSSIKEEVKKKHFSAGRNFSCLSAHSIEQVLF